MYFRLLPHCHLVKGACKGAIYDLKGGKVYSLNPDGVELLSACSIRPVNKLINIRNPNDRGLRFLESLAEKGLGSFFISSSSRSIELPPAPPLNLEFLWLELTSLCNNRCLHCYASCGQEKSSEMLPAARWKDLLFEARQEGATAVQLIGGEPTLYPEWRDILRTASEAGYTQIEIFTNATTLTAADIDLLKETGAALATTLYAGEAAVHDTVTQNPGSFAKTVQTIEMAVAAGIPVRVASIIMKTNEHEVENIMSLCARLKVESGPPDVVRPTGRGSDKDLLPVAYTRPPIRPPFYTDEGSFFRAQQQHPCLAGRLAVTATGDVLPCIFARSQVCGNIARQTLREVLTAGLLETYWKTTKDQVKKCQDCEYRYACHDCRPLAQGKSSDQDWLACPAECSYNPYSGEWETEKTGSEPSCKEGQRHP